MVSDCRTLSRLEICSHRASLGQSDKGNDAPFLERMRQLANGGIVCYDIDVVATADGQLVVGYPFHIVAELRAAGRQVQNGQLETVPWDDYVAAGLHERHPLLQDVLAAFANISAERDATAAAAGAAVGAGGGGGRVVSGGDAGLGAAGEGAGSSAGVGSGVSDVSGPGAASPPPRQEGSRAEQQQAAEGQSREPQHQGGGGEQQLAEQAAADADQLKEEQQQRQTTTQQEVKEQEALLLQQQQQRGTSPPPRPPLRQKQPPSQLQQQENQGQRRPEEQPQEAIAGEGEQQQQQAVSQVGEGRRLLVLKEEGQEKQGEQAPQQLQQQERGAVRAHGDPLLLIELKDSAMRVDAVELVRNATRELGVERRVGLWLVRLPDGPKVTQEVVEHLRGSDSGLLKVLGLPDSRRFPNGTKLAVPLQLQPLDAETYDIFGPSVMHPDAILTEVVEVAGRLPVVTWVVDSLEDAMRALRAGVGLLVANDPMRMRDRMRSVAKRCPVSFEVPGGGAAEAGSGSGGGEGGGGGEDGGGGGR